MTLHVCYSKKKKEGDKNGSAQDNSHHDRVNSILGSLSMFFMFLHIHKYDQTISNVSVVYH